MRRRVNGVRAVLLVDRLAHDETPAAVAAFEEGRRSARWQTTSQLDALRPARAGDRHLRLRNRAIRRPPRARVPPRNVRMRHAALKAPAGDADELLKAALEPRRVHHPIVVPAVRKRAQSPASRHSAQFSTRSRISSRSVGKGPPGTGGRAVGVDSRRYARPRPGPSRAPASSTRRWADRGRIRSSRQWSPRCGCRRARSRRGRSPVRSRAWTAPPRCGCRLSRKRSAARRHSSRVSTQKARWCRRPRAP